MLSILPQIHIFVNSMLVFSQSSLHVSNCIRIKFSRYTPIKPDCHYPTRFWPSSPSHYPGSPMRKLTSITRRKGQLRLTGFSISTPTVVLKDSKPHALTNRQSADRFDNLSCVHISEWEYIFQVTYVLRWRQRLST